MRRLLAISAVPIVLSLAACTSSGGHHAKSSSPSTAALKGTPADPKALAAQLTAGVAKVKTAHVDLKVLIAGQSAAGQGDEQLRDGKVQAVRVTQDLGGTTGSVEVIVVGGQTYGKLPTSVNKTGKPYVLITKTSKDATIAQLATSIDSLLASASLDSVATFINASSSVRDLGAASIGGTSTKHYSVLVVPAKLPATFPGRSNLVSSGLREVPLDLYVDADGRPAQVTEALNVLGQQVTVQIAISRYNQPVTITAPPASQVGTP